MSELLIKNGMVYTYIYEGYHAIKLQKADVYIKDGFIAETKPGVNRDCETLDATGCLVLPGMVNMGANTFAARIVSGLLCDRRAGAKQVAPMLKLASETLSEDEISAIAMTGLWETVSSGVTTVIERYSSEAVGRGMSRAAAALGVRLPAAEGGMKDIWTESAVTCAHMGLPYGGLEQIKSGLKMGIGTGCFDSCMIAEMRAVACSVKQGAGDTGAYKAADVFYSATVVGGRTLDAEKYGRLGLGFNGDLSVVGMDRFAPLSYPLAQYIYGANAGDVRHVVCGGNTLKRDYKSDGRLRGILAEARETAGGAILKLWAEARRKVL